MHPQNIAQHAERRVCAVVGEEIRRALEQRQAELARQGLSVSLSRVVSMTLERGLQVPLNPTH